MRVSRWVEGKSVAVPVAQTGKVIPSDWYMQGYKP